MERILIAGHSRMPRGTSLARDGETFALILEVEARHGVILRADSTLTTQAARTFLADLLIGHSLVDGLEDAIQAVERRYRGRSAKAIIASLRDAQAIFLECAAADPADASRSPLRDGE